MLDEKYIIQNLNYKFWWKIKNINNFLLLHLVDFKYDILWYHFWRFSIPTNFYINYVTCCFWNLSLFVSILINFIYCVNFGKSFHVQYYYMNDCVLIAVAFGWLQIWYIVISFLKIFYSYKFLSMHFDSFSYMCKM
jgi:hypothetical protein